VKLMNSTFRSIKISITVFRAPNFAGAFFRHRCDLQDDAHRRQVTRCAIRKLSASASSATNFDVSLVEDAGPQPVEETTGRARTRLGVSTSCKASKELKAASGCALSPTGSRRNEIEPGPWYASLNAGIRKPICVVGQPGRQFSPPQISTLVVHVQIESGRIWRWRVLCTNA
jgi:hypothetical protein